MILTYNNLIKYVKENGLEKAVLNVKKVAIGIFEPLKNVSLNIKLEGLDIKAFNTRLQNIPLSVISEDEFAISAQALALDDPMNSHFPGEFSYGGAFLIEDLINYKDLDLRITGYSNDVHEKNEIRKFICLEDVAAAELTVDLEFSQKEKAYINSSDHYKFSQCGLVKSNRQTVNFCRNGLGSVIYDLLPNIEMVFMAGTKAEIYRKDKSIKLIGDFTKMDTLYISGLSIKGYGVFLAAGLGFLIEINNDKATLQKIIDNEQKIFDVYDLVDKKIVGSTTFESLKNEYLTINEHKYKSCSLTSIYMSERIAEKVIAGHSKSKSK